MLNVTIHWHLVPLEYRGKNISALCSQLCQPPVVITRQRSVNPQYWKGLMVVSFLTT